MQDFLDINLRHIAGETGRTFSGRFFAYRRTDGHSVKSG